MAQDFTLAKPIENVVAETNLNLILNVQLIMTLLCLLPLLEIVHVLIKFNQTKDVFLCDYITTNQGFVNNSCTACIRTLLL
jgi:type IV secretory pathway component VirB8